MESKVTPEKLKEAFEVFDAIIKGKENSAVAANADAPVVDEAVIEDKGSDDIVKANETAAILFKAGMTKEVIVDTLVKGGFNAAISATSAESFFIEEKGVGSDAVLKSEQITELVKSEIKSSLTAVDTTIGKVNDTIIKGFEGMKLVFQDLTEKNDILVKSNSELVERLEKLESSPAGGPKSVTNVKAIDKFAKGEGDGDISKADGIDTFNVSEKVDLRKLVNRCMAENTNIIEKSGKSNPILERTISAIEMLNTVPEESYQTLAALKIRLVKPKAA